MLRVIATIAAVLLTALLAYAATLPDTFRVERAVSVNAAPEKIFPLISDLRGWNAWSPYEKKDPAMHKRYSGAASGKGAAMEWEGNKDVGKGRLEITDAVPSAKVAMRLHMLAPMEAENDVQFTLNRQGDATAVTWAMQGAMPYVSKLVSVFIDMDAMIGKDFEAGLASLKNLAER
jgi:hypothetical protein